MLASWRPGHGLETDGRDSRIKRPPASKHLSGRVERTRRDDVSAWTPDAASAERRGRLLINNADRMGRHAASGNFFERTSFFPWRFFFSFFFSLSPLRWKVRDEVRYSLGEECFANPNAFWHQARRNWFLWNHRPRVFALDRKKNRPLEGFIAASGSASASVPL